MDVLGYLTPLPGVFVAGIFAASLSSVSSGVNALASVFYVDVIALAKDGIPDRTGAKIINFLGKPTEGCILHVSPLRRKCPGRIAGNGVLNN